MQENYNKTDQVIYTWVYRLVIGSAMFPLFVLFGLGFYFRLVEPWKFAEGSTTPVLDHIAEMMSWEIHVAFFIFSALAVIWAVATPKWVERFWDKVTDRALVLAFWMIVVSAIYGWLS
jgi:hypothetical protein